MSEPPLCYNTRAFCQLPIPPPSELSLCHNTKAFCQLPILPPSELSVCHNTRLFYQLPKPHTAGPIQQLTPQFVCECETHGVFKRLTDIHPH